MIVDSSAIVAILKKEPEADRFEELLAGSGTTRLSAASYLEIGIVVDRLRSPVATKRLDDFLLAAGITIEPVTEVQARLARDAHRRFGRGSGHRARLNFGDCFAYALARDKDEPLLFKGTDFGSTDVRLALG